MNRRELLIACTRRWPCWIGCGVLVAGLQAVVWAETSGDSDRMALAAQAHGPKAVSGWQALRPVLMTALGQADVARLHAINDFFNRRIVFHDDVQVWGQVDYWSSPFEMLGRGEGDCEDFALAKYFSLRAVGVAASKLRLVYVRAQMGGPGGPVQAHMVLAYYAQPDAEPLILDNLISELRPASRRPDLTPVFSFNADGLWQGTGAQSAGDPLARLSRWRDALAKARAEGFPP